MGITHFICPFAEESMTHGLEKLVMICQFYRYYASFFPIFL
jgi:hypothetical protein